LLSLVVVVVEEHHNLIHQEAVEEVREVLELAQDCR
jgi:hypothetical protein